MLAQKMGKTRLIAETGAGRHGVATATAAALFGMECEIFMGKDDRTAGAQRLPNGAFGREGSPGYQRHHDFEGRGQRNHAGMDQPGL